jgi:hypothetical protein
VRFGEYDELIGVDWRVEDKIDSQQGTLLDRDARGWVHGAQI